ncbi:sialidase family protein [Paenibacillus eucommiae]|uniref:Exo-alpha-sialidase n=1 Tax=Paenibacillus eucommiae TaxID=1355755 RepID=A0ABS4IV58_9BACL|nr:sialidase family protein [Paenibacillus eucommiae]MBP1991457.1 hypothetical protein [Paenibacillus eucommiae]
MSAIQPLAQSFVKVYESPLPASVYCYSPGITRLSSGRLVVSLDLSGPGARELPGPWQQIEAGFWWSGKVFTSDDRGSTWTHKTDFPFMHARPFTAGSSLYVLGHCHDLTIMRSDDEGETWSEPVRLTDGQEWHQAPCNVHYTQDSIYLVMEKKVHNDMLGWPVSVFAPVLMRGRLDTDLTKRENWTFASELVFRDAVPAQELNYFGVPFFLTPPKSLVAIAPGREASPIGWLETNVVQIVDPSHYWYSEERTFHLWMRAHTGGTGYAALAKVVEHSDGSMTTMLETVPSGKTVVYVPCPGGQMKFHILYDEVTRLYWLLSSQATDSMTRAELLSPERFNLPNNERHRLQLHFSKNCIDWCFAGLVATGGTDRECRHYASMVIDGEDLHLVSRSGDAHAADAHNGNIISFHSIPRFRDLVY